jgi:hypothetical protein
VTFATLNGQRVIAAHVHVPGFGAWVADVALDDQAASPPTGQVTLVVGDLTLTGTVLPAASGTFNQKGWYRIIAGAGRWSTILPSKGYHNDAGMKASLVINDVAREAGETIGTFTDATLQGVDFVRQAGPASRIFVEALGNGINWWVDYAGTTQVGMRATSTPAAGADYDLIEYHPDSRIAVFATETPSVLTIGAMITNPRLVAPVTIRELDISLTATSLRVSAWVDEAGQVGPFDTRILRALRARARDVPDGRLPRAGPVPRHQHGQRPRELASGQPASGHAGHDAGAPRAGHGGGDRGAHARQHGARPVHRGRPVAARDHGVRDAGRQRLPAGLVVDRRAEGAPRQARDVG